MIKAAGTDDKGKKFAILGIDRENVKRLKNNKPINVDLKPLGIDGEVVIVYGNTTAQLKEILSPLISPNTQMGVGIGKGSLVD